LRPFVGEHDHDLRHSYWTRTNVRKYYKPEVRALQKSQIFPEGLLSSFVPVKKFLKQLHPR
jgi:hypothetical protein